MIESCSPNDAAAVCAIYNPYVESTTISFETAPVSETEMSRRIEKVLGAHPWLVWREQGAIRGYAYASRWRERAAYDLSVETTIYIASDSHSRGIGRRLYAALLEDLARRGFHMAMGGIALPNDASVALHERLGFVKVAHFSEVGRKFGRNVDVGYWARSIQLE